MLDVENGRFGIRKGLGRHQPAVDLEALVAAADAASASESARRPPTVGAIRRFRAWNADRHPWSGASTLPRAEGNESCAQLDRLLGELLAGAADRPENHALHGPRPAGGGRHPSTCEVDLPALIGSFGGWPGWRTPRRSISDITGYLEDEGAIQLAHCGGPRRNCRGGRSAAVARPHAPRTGATLEFPSDRPRPRWPS